MMLDSTNKFESHFDLYKYVDGLSKPTTNDKPINKIAGDSLTLTSLKVIAKTPNITSGLNSIAVGLASKVSTPNSNANNFNGGTIKDTDI